MPATAREHRAADGRNRSRAPQKPVLLSIVVDLAQAHTHLSSGDPEDPETVHQARRALTRARGAVRLLRPELDGVAGSIDDRLRRSLHDLSGSRDAVACQEACRRLGERQRNMRTARALRRASELARSSLSCEQSHAPADAGFATVCDRLSALREALSRFADELEAPGPDEAHARGLAHGLGVSWQSARRAFRRARRDPTPEHLHRWRRRVRDLRTQVALLTGSDPRLTPGCPALELHARLDGLAKVRGHHHDLTLVRAAAGRLATRSDRKRAVRAIEREDRRLCRSALRLGRRIFSSPPARHIPPG